MVARGGVTIAIGVVTTGKEADPTGAAELTVGTRAIASGEWVETKSRRKSREDTER